MSFQKYSLNPHQEIERFKASYINFFNLWKITNEIPAGVELSPLDTYSLKEDDLPDSLKALLAELRNNFPTKQLKFIKYIRYENGNPVQVVENEAGLPESERLLTLSRTVSINTIDFVKIITELFVAEKN